MRWWRLVLVGLALAQVAATPTHLPELTADEAALLAKREVVIRYEDAETGGATVAVIDVDAPPDKVFAAIVDMPARTGDVGSLRGADVYSGSVPERALGVRWEIRSWGMGVVFHTLYTLDPDARVAAFTLDRSKENDIVSTDGAYAVHPRGDHSRLVYRASSDSGRRVPEWIKNWLTQGALVEQLTGMRNRAEAAP